MWLVGISCELGLKVIVCFSVSAPSHWLLLWTGEEEQNPPYSGVKRWRHCTIDPVRWIGFSRYVAQHNMEVMVWYDILSMLSHVYCFAFSFLRFSWEFKAYWSEHSPLQFQANVYLRWCTTSHNTSDSSTYAGHAQTFIRSFNSTARFYTKHTNILLLPPLN